MWFNLSSSFSDEVGTVSNFCFLAGGDSTHASWWCIKLDAWHDRSSLILCLDSSKIAMLNSFNKNKNQLLISQSVIHNIIFFCHQQQKLSWDYFSARTASSLVQRIHDTSSTVNLVKCEVSVRDGTDRKSVPAVRTASAASVCCPHSLHVCCTLLCPRLLGRTNFGRMSQISM